MSESIDEMQARILSERKIFCPFCWSEFKDEDGQCVSYWGEDGPKDVFCLKCGELFEVNEKVNRTYETAKPDQG